MCDEGIFLPVTTYSCKVGCIDVLKNHDLYIFLSVQYLYVHEAGFLLINLKEEDFVAEKSIIIIKTRLLELIYK